MIASNKGVKTITVNFCACNGLASHYILITVLVKVDKPAKHKNAGRGSKLGQGRAHAHLDAVYRARGYLSRCQLLAMSSKKKTRNALALKTKCELIDFAKKNPHLSSRTLAEKFGCGKTQVNKILSNKESLLEQFESNVSSDCVLLRKRSRSCEFSEINESLYKWYSLATTRNIYPAGPQLCEKARQIADQLDVDNFKASNGWLDRWKKRYDIHKMKINGESGDVSGDTIVSWKERIPELLSGYSAENILNLDETGCFWRALPEHGFGRKGTQCKGGKKAKQRFTIALIANAAGGKECAIVIWKAEKPRCFKGVDVSKLPVKYYSQANAWMNGEILDDVLSKLNRHLSSRSRSVVLIMDNAGCHPQELRGKYSHIKIIFLPPNTTSQIQPLDLGIIQNFKVHYRKLLLRYVLSKIDETDDSASQIVQSVTVLTAIRWVAEAWESVKEETIMKCFRNAGITGSSFSVVSRAYETEDPFDEVDAQEELRDLVDEIPGNCPVEEYIDGENDIPICMQYYDDWEERFFAELGSSQGDSDNDPDEEEEQFDVEPPPTKITKFQDAISSLEAVQAFLDSKGYPEESTNISKAANKLTYLHCASLQSARQSTLREYFEST